MSSCIMVGVKVGYPECRICLGSAQIPIGEFCGLISDGLYLIYDKMRRRKNKTAV